MPKFQQNTNNQTGLDQPHFDYGCEDQQGLPGMFE